MRLPVLSELDDDKLLMECERSFERLQALDESVPPWVREIRVAYHNCLSAELNARGLLSSSTEGAHVFESLALRAKWKLLQAPRLSRARLDN
jgi:hypothetical protein